MPGENKAILKLSDGTSIALNDSASQIITDQGISINKTNGVLTYNAALSSQSRTVYNTMITPKGGQYQLILPDGSKVWLNSASSLKYPAIFNGQKREVELDGEAYFEIKENKSMPFNVKTNKVEVTVLGTRFNLNCYKDEARYRLRWLMDL